MGSLGRAVHPAMSLVGALVKKFLALEKYFVKDKGIVEQGVLNPELLAGLPLKLVDSCVNFDASVSFKEDQPNRVQSHDGISLEIEVLSSPYKEEGREEALLRLRRRKARLLSGGCCYTLHLFRLPLPQSVRVLPLLAGGG
eukprot:s6906_g1.t1